MPSQHHGLCWGCELLPEASPSPASYSRTWLRPLSPELSESPLYWTILPGSQIYFFHLAGHPFPGSFEDCRTLPTSNFGVLRG